ncbi:LysR family transcriptional regulator [Sorangium sp. So ce204]|uniref:LysR family transcriptional regulator n=2 Tax=unclassified Sorangium TaxID=2621164 RepID=UPI003F606373
MDEDPPRWQGRPMDWDDCRVLLEVHRRGSFLAAGQRLGMSASTVMRRVSTLERALGRSVVHRTSHGVRLEREALALVKIAAGFEQALGAHDRERAGTVRLSVPEGFGAVAAQAARRCWEQDRTTIVEVSVESRLVDLAEREADIGLRGGRSASNVLIEKRVGEVKPALYASAAYLAAHLPGRLVTRDDYTGQRFIVDERITQGLGPFRWLVERGAQSFPLRSNAVETRLEAARAGMGIVVHAAGVDVPGLEPVALDAPGPSLPFYVVMHRELRQVPRMRAMARALGEMFAEYTTKATARG